MIKITLPWPPSLNHYKKMGGFSRTKSGKLFQKRVNSKDTMQFYFDVWVLAKQIHDKLGTKFYHDGTIELEVYLCLHPPHQKRYDADNFAKVVIDSLMHAKLIKDDSQITKLVIEKKEFVVGGKVIVRIDEMIRL